MRASLRECTDKKKKGNKCALERMKIPFPLFSTNTGRQKIADDLAIQVCNALCEWRGLNELQKQAVVWGLWEAGLESWVLAKLCLIV